MRRRILLHRPIFAVAAVLVGSFIANFHGRIFSIGLPDIRGALSLSVDEGAWLSTSVTAPQIFIAPAVVWLATVFGIRRVLIGPGLLYALVSLLIPFAHNYSALLSLNIVHALLLGTFVPATIMIIFRNRRQRRERATRGVDVDAGCRGRGPGDSSTSSWAMTSFADASSTWTPRKMMRSSNSLV